MKKKTLKNDFTFTDKKITIAIETTSDRNYLGFKKSAILIAEY